MRRYILSLALATDLYELTMAQSYIEERKDKTAVFSLFVRRLKNRNFLVCAGLETLLERIKNFRFTEEELQYLQSQGFSQDFLSYLKGYRFSGNIYAIDEGRIIFENEPLIQVEASLPDAQIIETLVLNTMHLQTTIASKAARIYLAAEGRSIVDFGLRRAHGVEAGLYAARAAYIAGVRSTSNLMAGKAFNIPVVGTMAHSYVEIYDLEEKAFQSFAKSFPDNAVFLIDTYDTIESAKKVIQLSKKGINSKAVRIDSGDLVQLSQRVRAILDESDLQNIKIIVSGGLDEYDLERLVKEKAPIDVFAVGTMLVTSADRPYLDMAYKLVEYDRKPKFKLSPGKVTFPYKRQVVRHYSEKGLMKGDEIIRYGDKPTGEALVTEVIEGTRMIYNSQSLDHKYETFLKDLTRLPESLKSLDESVYKYPVILKD
ncbi:nicotinate phosphoribosyltransferase [[Eubacterium] cellulosolvens]